MTTGRPSHAEILAGISAIRSLLEDEIVVPIEARPLAGTVTDSAGWPNPWSPRTRLRFHADSIELQIWAGNELLYSRRLLYA